MKKNLRSLSWFLPLLLAVCLLAVSPKAQAASESDLTFKLNSDGQSYTVSGCNTSASGSLEIPTTYNGKPVTGIDREAFFKNTGLTSVTIPDSVTGIDADAFSYCSSLTSVTIPDSVTGIGSNAFSYCSSLTSVTIPDSVTFIGFDAFFSCTDLTSVTIGNSVTTIDDYAFARCSSLTTVTIPDSITTIGPGAFKFCSSLQYNTYSNGLYLGNSDNPYVALMDTTSDSITAIQIHNKTKIIAGSAFEYCSSLTTVTIPDSVIAIGSDAFSGCRSLKYNTHSNGLYLGNSDNPYVALIDTTSGFITSIRIHNKTKIIADYVFSSSLTDVYFTETEGCWDEINIGRGNTSLTNATIHYAHAHSFVNGLCECGIKGGTFGADGDNLIWTWESNGLITISGTGAMNDYSWRGAPWHSTSVYKVNIENGVTTIGKNAFSNCSSLTAVTIGNGVTSIGDSAFEDCYDLTSVTIGDSVTTIDSSAFEGCSSLTSVTIGDSVTTIDSSAFEGCSSLTSVTIGDSVTTIDSSAFEGCSSLTSVTIPGSVTTIGSSVFSYCTSLTGIWVDAQNSVFSSDDKGVLFNKDKSQLIQVPCKLSGAYSIPDSITSIGSSMFSGCNSLTSVTIPDSVTTIGNYAFSNCRSLTSVTIPDSVTSIGDYAFRYCSSLTSVTIGNGVTDIGYETFTGCSSLTGIWVSEQNSVYSSDAYGVLFDKDKKELILAPKGMTGTYTIPDSVTNIADSAFISCSSLISVIIPDSVTTIGYSAFSGCSSLQYNTYSNGLYLGNSNNPYVALVDTTSTSITSLQIHNKTKIICNHASAYCSSLTSVTIPDSVTTIGSYAFTGCSSLTSLTIPDSVTTIDISAFSRCSKLTLVTIPDSVTTIGSHVFSQCSSLISVTIGNSITTISADAFSCCSNLTSVVIGNSVTAIDFCAFSSCSSLTDVYYNGTQDQWNAIDIFHQRNDNLKSATIYFAGSLVITQQPANATVDLGENAKFTIAADGDGVNYRWQYSKDGGRTWLDATSSMNGYKKATLTIEGTLARNGYQFRCKITDSDGNLALSNAVTLTVETLASFISHPQAETVKLGNRAAFTVEAEGEVKTYQWQYQMVENGPWWNCTQYTKGYNTPTLNVIAAEKREGFLYRCRVTDTAGNKYYSNPAELTVDIPESYAILSQPKDTYVMAGNTTTFHIDTQGEGLTYQWEYHKGVDKSGPEYYWIAMGSTTGCKTDTLTIAGVSGSTNRDGWAYRCVVTDSNGYIYTTDYAFLHVTTAQIDTQPQSVTAAAGSNALFAVEASGKVASYQWQYSKDGGKSWYNSSSATRGYNTDTLTVGATAARNGFLYRCKITDSEGNLLITAPAQLTVE